MTGMRLPIACSLLFLFNFDAPVLGIHERDCLIMLALCDEPENALRPSLHACCDEGMLAAALGKAHQAQQY